MDRRTRRQTDVILSSSSSATLSSTVKYATTYINSYGSKSVLPCCYIEAVYDGVYTASGLGTPILHIIFICKYLLCMHIKLLWCGQYVVKKSYTDVTFGLSCTNLACSVLSAWDVYINSTQTCDLLEGPIPDQVYKHDPIRFQCSDHSKHI